MKARGNLALLLSELRTWKPGEPRKTAQQLSHEYGVDCDTIILLAKSYGVNLDLDPGVPNYVDSDATTQPIDLTA